MFTIWCHGNLALDDLQLVLIVSRAPCFGVEPLKVAALPILQSLCCLHPALVHSLVHTALVQTVLVHCRGGGRGGLQAFSGSPQIHSKCLPHSQPHCQPPLSGLHTFSMPATRLSQSDPHLTLSIFAPASHDHMSALHGVPPSFTFYAQHQRALPYAIRQVHYQWHWLQDFFGSQLWAAAHFNGCAVYFFPTFCFDNSPDYTDYISLNTI